MFSSHATGAARASPNLPALGIAEELREVGLPGLSEVLKSSDPMNAKQLVSIFFVPRSPVLKGIRFLYKLVQINGSVIQVWIQKFMMMF